MKKNKLRIALCLSLIAALNGGCSLEKEVKEPTSYENYYDIDEERNGYKNNEERVYNFMKKEFYENTYLVENVLENTYMIAQIKKDGDTITSFSKKTYYVNNGLLAEQIISNFDQSELKVLAMNQSLAGNVRVYQVRNIASLDENYKLEEGHISFNGLDFQVMEDKKTSSSITDMIDNLKNNMFNAYEISYESRVLVVYENIFEEAIGVYKYVDKERNILEELPYYEEYEIIATLKEDKQVLKK